jgi:hypothetical protein
MYHLLAWAFAVINSLAGIAGLGTFHGRSIYCIVVAISYFPLVLSAAYYDKTNKMHRRSLRSVAALCISNILDEMFFNPLVLSWNELFFAAEVVVYNTGFYSYIYSKLKNLWKSYTSLRQK